MSTLGYGEPHVGTLDMGWDKPVKFFYWCPWPIWQSINGTNYYRSRALYATKERAEKALGQYLSKTES